MAEFDFSSYPKPQAQQNPLDMITKVGGALSTLGDIEAGKAVQGAIGPDGEIDRNAVMQSLKGSVAGSMKAVPQAQALEQLRSAGFGADQAGLETFQKRMALVNHVFGHIASKDNPTINDVNSAAARLLDPGVNGPKYGLNFPVVMEALKKFRGPDGRPLNSQQIKQMALDMQTMTATTSEQLGAHSPRYSVVDDGATIKFEPVGTQVNPQYPNVVKRIPTGTPQIGPDGRTPVLTPAQPPAPSLRTDAQGRLLSAPPGSSTEVDSFGRPIKPPPAISRTPNQLEQAITPAQRVAQGFQDTYGNRLEGAPKAGLAPGVAAAATSTAETSAKLGNELTVAANEVPATMGILDNLERELKGFTPGPGADWRRLGKAFANTVIPESLKDKIGFDPKSIADQEGFNKLAYNLAQNQFQALGGTGTDAKLNSTMATSPSELLSKEGNEGIIRLLKGNTDALRVKSKEWNKFKKTHGEDSFGEFSDVFNETFNPRVFQFKYVPPAERQRWLNAMDPADRKRFLEAAEYARDKGWIKKGGT